MTPDGSEPTGPNLGGRVPVLDGWRGFAILVVVLHNGGFLLYGLEGPRGLVTTLTLTTLASGWVGVQLFFVLSGFLITGILVDTAGAPGYFRSFYLRRTLRIFPVYYAFLAFCFLLAPRVPGGAPWIESQLADQVWYWTYLSNWRPLLASPSGPLSHLWSLAVEEQFYLLWPLLVATSGRRFPWVVILVMVAAPLSRLAMFVSGAGPDALYFFTNARADALAMGALMALAARSPRWWPSVVRWGPATLGLTTVLLLPVILVSGGFGEREPAVQLAGQSLISLWFAVLMALTMSPEGRLQERLAHLFEGSWLRSLGKYSYTMYVVHYPLSQVLLIPEITARAGPLSPAVQVGVTLGYGGFLLIASYALAVVSWRLLEQPLVRVKERVAPRPTLAG